LDYLQRIPHVDSFLGSQLAFVHYLFKADPGGTAFYRHRGTGFEIIDAVPKANGTDPTRRRSGRLSVNGVLA